MAHMRRTRGSSKQPSLSTTQSEGKPARSSQLQSDMPLTPETVMQLQRTLGNQQVRRLLETKESSSSLSDLATTPYPEIDYDVAIDNDAGAMIQRAWDDTLINYGVMWQEKTDGQIRTKKWKKNSIKDWVKSFVSALTKSNDTDALKALNGLKDRLQSDQLAASQGKLKAPKRVKNFDKLAAIQAANVFFTKWVGVVQEHLDYAANTGDWITDFRQKYINDPIAAGMNAKGQILSNAAKMDGVDGDVLQGIGQMWDLGGMAIRQRMTALMGGVSDLRRMSGLEYFLEQISPIHVGYSAAKAMFQFWTTAVLYHGWNTPWETWMVTKANDDAFEGKEIKIIDSYDPVTRAQYELTPTGKKIMKADHQPLVGDNIYVLTSDNKWYGSSKVGPVHHSSFMQGAPVKCAGHLHTDGGGNLQRIDINSGHYTPDTTALKRAMSVLSKQMDISDVKTGSY